MSVLIKKEMPQNCGECFARYVDNCGYIRCGATQQLVKSGAKDRYDNCPLVEIPTPHGRLIDADKLANETFYGATSAPYITYWKFVNAPTVIEAEDGTE